MDTSGNTKMSIEQKAKAYDKALEWIRKVYPTLTGADKEDVKYYFPEVKESEDEKIRKELAAFFKEMQDSDWHEKYWHDLEIDRILAWLEKQKVNTEGDFGRGYDCGYKACLNSHGAEFFEKQKEQKPADSVKEEYIKNRNDGTYTCATTNDGFDAFMDGFNKGYELGIKEQTKKQ